MKVETTKAVQNGYISGSQPSGATTTPGTFVKKENIDCIDNDLAVPVNGSTFQENQQDAQSYTSESTYSLSDVVSNGDNSISSLFSNSQITQEEQEISDLEDIVTSGVDGHHAAIALEAFLENLEFVPAEVNRLIKLITLLDEKCEEIMELLDRPSDDWFESRRRNKKQKKAAPCEEDELTAEDDSMTNIHSTKAVLIFRKIFEGQEDIGFDAYISKLKKARKQEKQKQLESRTIDYASLDNCFKVLYEKSSEVDDHPMTQGETSSKTQETPHVSQNAVAKIDEGETVAEPSQNTKTANAKRERGESDPIDHYFSQFDKDCEQFQNEDRSCKLMESEGPGLDMRNMPESWKEKLKDIRKENVMNQKAFDEMEIIDKFLEDKVSLLWRYTLRKKTLTRKLYETVLHHYVSLLQELEPENFTASLGCYPEATIIQNMLLNDMDEEYVNQKELLELYKDVDDMVDQFDEKDLISNPPPQIAMIVKAEDSTVGLLPPLEHDRNGVMTDTSRPEKPIYGHNFPRDFSANGTVSPFTASVGSVPGYDRSQDVPFANNPLCAFRRARNKRTKPIKPPPGMAQAAKSPQSTGRLLTYHDIATSTNAAKLSGHPAELFWPDDDLWYLIRINSIDPETKIAHIVYLTGGETETLELDDIVREGHMSLLPETEETDVSMEEGYVPRQANECEVNEDAMSELSASEPGAQCSDDLSVDGEDEELGSDDEDDDEIGNLQHHAHHHHHQHRRPPRRTEIKSERV